MTIRPNSSMPSDAVFRWRADAPEFFGQARVAGAIAVGCLYRRIVVLS